ncbi:MAG: RraA family protein [Crocinitomicaceae bacterium]|nr:RraA family protein [Crocinitomicaceae bacterium]
MDIKEQIIRKIKENRISSTEIADVLGKKGLVKGPKILNRGMHKVGEVAFVYAYNKSNWEVHEQLHDLEEGKIVYVHPIECEDKAIFGDLVSKYIMLYKRSVAIVTNGVMRDAHTLVKENYPIWCTDVSPIGCNNVQNTTQPDSNLLEELRSLYHGSIMVCDDSGVVMIKKEHINAEFLKKLDFIELQEDVWFLCMDTHKMSTYEIVCQKQYLDEESDIISKTKKEELKSYSTAK